MKKVFIFLFLFAINYSAYSQISDSQLIMERTIECYQLLRASGAEIITVHVDSMQEGKVMYFQALSNFGVAVIPGDATIRPGFVADFGTRYKPIEEKRSFHDQIGYKHYEIDSLKKRFGLVIKASNFPPGVKGSWISFIVYRAR